MRRRFIEIAGRLPNTHADIMIGADMTFTHPPGSKPLAGYTIKRGIGRGAYGEVYYAVSDGGKDVALKLIQQHVEVELRGVRECLNLEHPNLVRLYDVQQNPAGESWVVMEYCDGESLEEAIAAHPHGMPIDEVLNWFRGICAAVGYLHEHGIVHRDLKPSHVFREDGVVKICDYGLAKFISVSRRSGNTDGVGTVYYAAPEMAKGKYGKELDLYSLGVMLYEALSGDVPFDGETAAEILMKHLTEKPDVSRFPAPYRQIVARLLEKEPARRYRSVDELTETFDVPITAVPASRSLFGPRALTGRVLGWIQPKKRARRVFDAIKQNKLAACGIVGLCAAALGIGIAIGDANRMFYYGHSSYRQQPHVSSYSLSRVRVKRNDAAGNTVRLSELASFHRIRTTRASNGRVIARNAYELELDDARCKAASVGKAQVLEAMWDAGFTPVLQIDVDSLRLDRLGLRREHIKQKLRQHQTANSTRRRQMHIWETRTGFLVEFRRNRYDRSSNGIIGFHLLKPEAVFDLELEPNGSFSKERVPLKDVAEIIIAAGN